METTDLRDYMKPLLRWWWLILASTVVAGIASAWISIQQPPLYESRTTIMVGSTINNPNPDSFQMYVGEQLLTMYADIINRDSVREGTMQALGLEQLPDYTSRIIPRTQFMDITVIDTDATRTQAVAGELVNQLILRSPAGAEEQERHDFVYAQLDEFEAGIETTKAEVARLESSMAEMLSARQIADTQNQINALETKLGTLQSNYAQMLATTQRGATNTITVVEAANLPTEPIDSSLLLDILMAAGLGLLLGLGAAYLLEFLDDSVKDSEEIRKLLNVPTLSAVPTIADKELRPGELIMVHSPQSPPAEAFRILRTNLRFASLDRPVRSLLVSSALPREGKSFTAANLAVSLAQSGHRVVLVDGDMHRPRQHKLFGVANNVGVTSALLAQGADLTPYLHNSGVPNLALMTTGPLPPNSAELLGSQAMLSLIAQLQEEAEYVIVDSPPVLALSDATVLSTQVDGVLLVALAGKTRRDALQRAQAALQQVNANLVGVTFNRVPRRGQAYYYGYGYGYGGYDRKRSRSNYYRRADAGPVQPLTAVAVGANGNQTAKPEPAAPRRVESA